MITLKMAHGVTYEVAPNNDVSDPTEAQTVRLIGFQNEADVQRVNLFVDDWRKDPQRAMGKFPVFSRGEAGLYSIGQPVVEVGGWESNG